MAKMASISGIVCYVKNLEKTANFYEKLGFIVTDKTEDHVSIRLNWFWIEFQKAVGGMKIQATTSEFIYISVDDVDGFYADLKQKGIALHVEPFDEPNLKRREFLVADPDGYKLVFFRKNK